MPKATVIKNISNTFTISDNGKIYLASCKGSLRQDKVVVGDKVEYSLDKNKALLTKVLERKNTLIRPNIANIDNLIIVVSPVPKPDFLLIDKLILMCLHHDIKPIICVNKEDLSPDFFESVKSQYADVVLDLVNISAKTGFGIEALIKLLKGSVSAFAGQSAVGKSTILNTLLKSEIAQTGGISEKTQRGKHTTRHTEMFVLEDNTYVIDTPGFSMLNIPNITYDNLKFYYPDFAEFDCKYGGCTHTKENSSECGIKQAVVDGLLDKDRYERYTYIYNELKTRKRNYEKD